MTSLSDAESAPRLAFTTAYDGSAFQGWQSQLGLRTVQGELRAALGRIEAGDPPLIHGSGRTDAGVHARGQVFHCSPQRPLSPEKWGHALNAVLPADIRILGVRRVPDDFHARISAIAKEYRYFIHCAPVMPPDLRCFRLHLRRPPDPERMRQAMALLCGRHDFLSFSANRGYPEASTIRHLRRFELTESAETLCLSAEADGFLYKMVRRLTGAVLRVGLGDMSLDDLRALLAHPTRKHETPAVEPQGLFLWRVMYKDPA